MEHVFHYLDDFAVLGTPESAVHMVAARLGCKRAMVDTEWANSHPSRERIC